LVARLATENPTWGYRRGAPWGAGAPFGRDRPRRLALAGRPSNAEGSRARL